jgi:phi LC3 family holin
MNLKVRFKNPVFIMQIILSILLPILAYRSMSLQDITTWSTLGDLLIGAIKNPYLLGTVAVSIFNALTDPTTEGVGDSDLAMTYDKPKEKGKAIR